MSFFSCLEYISRTIYYNSLARNTRRLHTPNTASSSQPPPYLNIKLPDLSAPLPEPEVHIVGHPSYDSCSEICSKVTSFVVPIQPFTPDLWESSRTKAEAAAALPEEPHVPKVILIAGDSSRADSVSVPVQEHDSLELHHTEPSATAPAPNVSNARSLFLDVADDLVLPKDLSALKPLKGRLPQPDDLIDGTSTATSRRFHARTLDKDEVRGIWIILGLFAGSWLAGGLFKKESKYSESE